MKYEWFIYEGVWVGGGTKKTKFYLTFNNSLFNF